MRRVALFLALLLAAPAVLHAQQGPPAHPAGPPFPKPPFKRDDLVQWGQQRAASTFSQRFDEMDSNHDGVVDQQELKAWREAHRKNPPASAPAPEPGAAPPQ